MAGISKLSLVLFAAVAVVGLVPGIFAQKPEATVNSAPSVAAEDPAAVNTATEELGAAADTVPGVVAKESEAVVDPAFGADEMVQEVVVQQSSLRGAAGAIGEVEVEVEGQVEVEVGNSCHSGLVGKLYKMAPRCLDACSYSCGPLGQAISAYFKGGKKAAKRVVCAKKWAFSCPMKRGNRGKCQPLLSKAAGFGLPSSIGDLNRQCR